MKSIHSKSIVLRSAAAVVRHILGRDGYPSSTLGLLKAFTKLPVEYTASQAHMAIPIATFDELFPEYQDDQLIVPKESLRRHGWNVKLHEEIYLYAAVRALMPKKIFEIGTFNGQTTLALAKAAPEDSLVYTIDLPEDHFDATQGPQAFNGNRVGERYRGSEVESRIRQIRADATTYDFSPYYGQIDIVFVDAAHDYPHGLSDSQNALKLAKPGGAIIWHDFEPYWSGLVHAICESTDGLALRRLGGTSMAVLRTACHPLYHNTSNKSI